MKKETIEKVGVLLQEMSFKAQGKAEWTAKVGRHALPVGSGPNTFAGMRGWALNYDCLSAHPAPPFLAL